MKKREKTFVQWMCLLLIPIFFQAITVQGEVVYPEPIREFYVLDEADVLSDETEKLIIETGLNHEQTRSQPQIAVLTVESLQGISIEEYAVNLFERWGIGQADLDNGVLILFSEGDREIRIEVGYGLEGALTDSGTGRILDEHLDYLADDEFDQGIQEIFTDVVEEVNDEYLIETNEAGEFVEPTPAEAEQIRQERAERNRRILTIVFSVVGLGIVGLIILGIVWSRKEKKRREEERIAFEKAAVSLYREHHNGATTDLPVMVRYKKEYDAEQRRIEKEKRDRERATKALKKRHGDITITEQMIQTYLIQEAIDRQRRIEEQRRRDQQNSSGFGSGGSFGGGGMSGGGGASRGF